MPKTRDDKYKIVPGNELYHQEKDKDKWPIRKFKLSVNDVHRYKVNLTGQLQIEWWGDNRLQYLERGDEENSVVLANMKVGKPMKKVIEMKHRRKATEEFVVVTTYVVTRTK